MFKKIISVFSWLGKVFVSHAVSTAPVAITITEGIKALLANPVAGFLENAADLITGTNLPTAAVAYIQQLLPKVLAVELAIEGLPENATPAQVLAFEQAILAAFDITSNNSKLYTVLGAQIYGIIQSNIAAGTTNFADWVIAIQSSYTDYKSDLSANAVVVTTV